MPFLIYIAVALVSLSMILLELNWLTKPKLEAGAPAKIASTAKPAKPKVEGPSVVLSPLYPTKVGTADNDAAPAVKPVTAQETSQETSQAAIQKLADNNVPAVSQPALETTGAATAVAQLDQQPAANEPGANQTAASAPAVAVAATPVADESTVPAPVPAPQTQPRPAQQTQNTCAIQVCAEAYRSFRASDCSYQPFEGPRRACTVTPDAASAVARRTDNADETRRADAARRHQGAQRRAAELREAERVVREMTRRQAANYIDERRVIIIDPEPGPLWRRW